MEAGPRDTAQARTATGPSPASACRTDSRTVGDGPAESRTAPDGRTGRRDRRRPRAGRDAPRAGEVEVELRPQRRLRIWQLAPIVVLAAIGSLMFAFPLAFEFGDGGAVVAMLGPADLLLRRGLGRDGRPPGRLHLARTAAAGLRARARTGGSSSLYARGRGGARSRSRSGAWPGCAEPLPAAGALCRYGRRRPRPVRSTRDRATTHADRLPQGPRHRERLRDRPRPGRTPRPAPGRRRRAVRPAGRASAATGCCTSCGPPRTPRRGPWPARPSGSWTTATRDGSIAEMCGNGVRVFARYLQRAGHVPRRRPRGRHPRRRQAGAPRQGRPGDDHRRHGPGRCCPRASVTVTRRRAAAGPPAT